MRIIAFLLCAVISAAALPLAVRAAPHSAVDSVRAVYDIVPRPLREYVAGVEASGELPAVVVYGSPFFSGQVNAAVETIFSSALSGASESGVRRGSKLTFAFETHEFGDCVSILMIIGHNNGAANTETVGSVVFDAAKREFVTITSAQALGVNGVKAANKALREEAAAHIDLYNAGFADITDGQPFYIDGGADGDGEVVLVFDKFAVAPGYRGVTRFVMEKNKLIEIATTDFYSKGGYGTRMARLRQVAEAFGYRLGWDDALKAVDVSDGNGLSAAKITVGKAAYIKGRAAAFMEAAPELRGDWTYVPAAFFEDALGVSWGLYDGGLVFTKYVK